MASFKINGTNIADVCEVITQESTREKGYSDFFKNSKINTTAFLGSGKMIANAPPSYFWATDVATNKLFVQNKVTTNSARGCRPLLRTPSYTKYGSTTFDIYADINTNSSIIDFTNGVKIFDSTNSSTNTSAFKNKPIKMFFVTVTGGGGGSGKGGSNNTGSGGGGGGGGTAIACLREHSGGGWHICTVQVGGGGSAGGDGGTGGESRVTMPNGTIIARAYGGGGGTHANQSGNAPAGSGGGYTLATDGDRGKGVTGYNGTAGANGTAYNAGGRKGADLSCSLGYFPEPSGTYGINASRSTAAVTKNGSGGGGGHSVFATGASGGQGGAKGIAGGQGGAGGGGGGCTGLFASEMAGAAGGVGVAKVYYL